MLIHYLKITFRNLRKHKTQSLTGIFGLAFGIACFVPALYWMRYETTYDNFYPDAARIYRIYSVEKQSGKVNERVPGILEQKLHEHFPATETSVSFILEPDNYSAWETPYIRLCTLWADSTFFRVFPQTFVSGDARQPLLINGNIVLTETVAVRLFGDVEKAVGQQIQSKSFFFLPPYTVTAVIKDPPLNTNLQFDVILFLGIMHNMGTNMPEVAQWTDFIKQMYIKFHPHTNINKLAEQLRDFTSQIDGNANIEVRMMRISDILHHFNVDLPFTLNFIRLFVAAGLLLLFSALFNFLSFHLDIFSQRIRELRQRTVHGATSGQLITQMMFELACTILIALTLACCFVVLACPTFSGLLDMEIGLSKLVYVYAVCGICVMALMLFIGFFPFWRLSRLAMRHLSKGNSTRQPLMRCVAVTLQLTVSIIFIVAALVVTMQMRFVNHKDFGFDRSGIIHLSGLLETMDYQQSVLMRELASIPQIEAITTTDFEPQHNSNRMVTEVEWPGNPPYEKPTFQSISTDSRFAETFRLRMIEGKWWNEGERQKAVLNEEAVRVMGLVEPIGAMLRMSADFIPSDGSPVPMLEYEVVGVVNDFHTLSLRSRIHPTIIRQSFEPYNFPYIRVVPGQEQEAIQRITVILPDIDASLVGVQLTSIDELYDRLN
jgi:putative ABC transport system permease protein